MQQYSHIVILHYVVNRFKFPASVYTYVIYHNNSTFWEVQQNIQGSDNLPMATLLLLCSYAFS